MTHTDDHRRILAVIPARGGSKGIPRKNIREIAGKPLLAWTVEAAKACARISEVVVSTEDAEIAEVALRFGATVPFLRPADLARDDTPGIDPVLHAVEQLSGFDFVVVLQPTSPLRNSAHIDGCLDVAHLNNANSVVSVCEPDAHPLWTFSIDSSGHLRKFVDAPLISRRQDLPSVFVLNGAVYLARISWLKKHRVLVGPDTLPYTMSRESSVDIDSHMDWALAELLLKDAA
jgi:CMP-N,N'-diacetyllegionaminic acid synthase